MNKLNVLVIGAGLLGSYILRHSSQLGWTMHATYLPGDPPVYVPEAAYYPLDVIRKNDVERIIAHTKPALVIDTAAYCDVDGCEDKPDKSWKVNVEGTRNVFECCSQHAVKMVYISTDYVFDGCSSTRYRESDDCHPLNIYGIHKREAETLVLQEDNLVCRASVIYGQGRKNFVLWVINELKSDRTISVIDDQYNCPTYAGDLAGMIAGLKEQNGIFHTVGSECLNRYELCLKVADVFGLDDGLIRPVPTDQLEQRAQRPGKCDLSTGKVEQISGRKPMSLKAGLQAMKEEKSNG